MIYFDFRKSIDKIDLGMTCHKLRRFGRGGKLGECLNDFLKDRRQAVTANGSLSKEAVKVSGVPHRTDYECPIGMLLFIVALSDIPSLAQA